MKNVNRRTICCIIGMVLLLICLMLFLKNNAYPTPQYNGDRIHNETQFSLHFTSMNGTQEHTMPLKAGDILHCMWQIDRGTVSIDISGAGTKAYHGDKIDSAEFDLIITDDGDFNICVSGNHAMGRIDIIRQER